MTLAVFSHVESLRKINIWNNCHQAVQKTQNHVRVPRIATPAIAWSDTPKYVMVNDQVKYITEHMGSIISHAEFDNGKDYPNGYDAIARFINLPKDRYTTIALYFVNFAIEDDTPCDDYLRMDVNSYCGTQLNKKTRIYKIRDDYFGLAFHTDWISRDAGFKIQFRVTIEPPPTTSPKPTTTSSTSISTPQTTNTHDPPRTDSASPGAETVTEGASHGVEIVTKSASPGAETVSEGASPGAETLSAVGTTEVMSGQSNPVLIVLIVLGVVAVAVVEGLIAWMYVTKWSNRVSNQSDNRAANKSGRKLQGMTKADQSTLSPRILRNQDSKQGSPRRPGRMAKGGSTPSRRIRRNEQSRIMEEEYELRKDVNQAFDIENTTYYGSAPERYDKSAMFE